MRLYWYIYPVIYHKRLMLCKYAVDPMSFDELEFETWGWHRLTTKKQHRKSMNPWRFVCKTLRHMTHCAPCTFPPWDWNIYLRLGLNLCKCREISIHGAFGEIKTPPIWRLLVSMLESGEWFNIVRWDLFEILQLFGRNPYAFLVW